MTHTTFTYTCLVLAILIAIGFIIMIITIRRLHKAQKQLQKRTKQMTRKKDMTGTGTNHFIFIHEQPPEQNIETQRASDYFRLKPV